MKKTTYFLALLFAPMLLVGQNFNITTTGTLTASVAPDTVTYWWSSEEQRENNSAKKADTAPNGNYFNIHCTSVKTCAPWLTDAQLVCMTVNGVVVDLPNRIDRIQWTPLTAMPRIKRGDGEWLEICFMDGERRRINELRSNESLLFIGYSSIKGIQNWIYERTDTTYREVVCETYFSGFVKRQVPVVYATKVWLLTDDEHRFEPDTLFEYSREVGKDRYLEYVKGCYQLVPIKE